MKAGRFAKRLLLVTWAATLMIVGIATSDANSGTLPSCYDIVEYNSVDGASEGDACYNACTSGASMCASGLTYKKCNTSPVNIICQKGTWKKNLDGTWGCWNSTGLHTVAATVASGESACSGSPATP